MAFPTLAQLDAIVIPAMATTDELAAVHRTRDGVETACVAWLDEVSVESYTESGMTATSQRREITIQRAEVARPLAQDTVEIGDEGEHRVRRRLLELLRDGLGEGVARLEVGAGIPERSGDDIPLAVTVEVGGVHSVAPVFGRERAFLEGNGARGGGESRERQGEAGKQGDKRTIHGARGRTNNATGRMHGERIVSRRGGAGAHCGPCFLSSL